MIYRCKKVGCRRQFRVREDLDKHIEIDHRPPELPVRVAAPAVKPETEQPAVIAQKRFPVNISEQFVLVKARDAMIIIHRETGDTLKLV